MALAAEPDRKRRPASEESPITPDGRRAGESGEGDFRFRLGVTLTMELIGLSILRLGAVLAGDDDVVALFADHHVESCRQVDSLGEIFRISGWDVDGYGCPAAETLWAQTRRTCRQAPGPSRDVMLLRDAMQLERHEIAVYERLAHDARAIGREECVELLSETITAERRVLTLVTALAARPPC